MVLSSRLSFNGARLKASDFSSFGIAILTGSEFIFPIGDGVNQIKYLSLNEYFHLGLPASVARFTNLEQLLPLYLKGP